MLLRKDVTQAREYALKEFGKDLLDVSDILGVLEVNYQLTSDPRKTSSLQGAERVKHNFRFVLTHWSNRFDPPY